MWKHLNRVAVSGTASPDSGVKPIVRVLEIPTPRWIAYEEKKFGTHAPKEALRKQQERAYTLPVWYTPSDILTQR